MPARCYSPSAQGGHHAPRQRLWFSADAHAGIAVDAYRLFVTGGRVEEVDLVRRLRETCYRGPMKLEVFNDDVTKQHPEIIATLAHALILRLLEREGW